MQIPRQTSTLEDVTRGMYSWWMGYLCHGNERSRKACRWAQLKKNGMRQVNQTRRSCTGLHSILHDFGFEQVSPSFNTALRRFKGRNSHDWNPGESKSITSHNRISASTPSGNWWMVYLLNHNCGIWVQDRNVRKEFQHVLGLCGVYYGVQVPNWIDSESLITLRKYAICVVCTNPP